MWHGLLLERVRILLAWMCAVSLTTSHLYAHPGNYRPRVRIYYCWTQVESRCPVSERSAMLGEETRGAIRPVPLAWRHNQYRGAHYTTLKHRDGFVLPFTHTHTHTHTHTLCTWVEGCVRAVDKTHGTHSAGDKYRWEEFYSRNVITAISTHHCHDCNIVGNKWRFMHLVPTIQLIK